MVVSPHTMRKKDIVWTEVGMDVSIRSSKTIQFKERVVKVPVVKADNSKLCPCGYLKYYLSRLNIHAEEPLFPFTYNIFSSRLKKACTQAGLIGNFTTHSLRRGSATFLSTFLPMHVVKTYGDWRSWAVLLYISDDYSSRKAKDVLVADKLSLY